MQLWSVLPCKWIQDHLHLDKLLSAKSLQTRIALVLYNENFARIEVTMLLPPEIRHSSLRDPRRQFPRET